MIVIDHVDEKNEAAVQAESVCYRSKYVSHCSNLARPPASLNRIHCVVYPSSRDTKSGKGSRVSSPERHRT